MGTSTTYRILVINPGSTSTKLAIFEDEICVNEQIIRHGRDEIDRRTAPNGSVLGQKEWRTRLVEQMLEECGFALESFHAFVGIATRLPPLISGTYRVDEALLADVPVPLIHAGLLGTLIARELGDKTGAPAFTVDPATVDELTDIARFTGIPGIKRTTICHVLNHHTVARRCGKEINVPYEKGRFVVAHMGGGISIAAHQYGRIVDSTNASNGEGPFSAERAGAIPSIPLIEMCFSGKYTKDEVSLFFTKKGGVVAYLGTSDMKLCEDRMEEGDETCRLLFEGMAYRVAKEIGAMTAVLGGDPDAIILTGGLAHSQKFIATIRRYVDKLGPVFVYPGEEELLGLAQGALRVLRGEEQPVDYAASRRCFDGIF